MLNLLRKTGARKRKGQGLYDGLVTRAREAVFFRDFAVADTIDGRFDMVVLHAWLALSALKEAGLHEAAQGLTDTIFIGFDEAMREQGAGDMGLSRKMKAFADAFYGRLGAYSQAKDEAQFAEALARNLWRGGAIDERARKLAGYAWAAQGSLKQSLPDALDFGPLPQI
jgi:cytochrome b pre-mRNA-processing protein 3